MRSWLYSEKGVLRFWEQEGVLIEGRMIVIAHGVRRRSRVQKMR